MIALSLFVILQKRPRRSYAHRVCQNKFKNSTGFTLIEVLISTLILTSLLGVTMIVYSMFIDNWTDGRIQDEKALNDYRVAVLLRGAVESAWDYYVTDPQMERKGIYYPFFKGSSQSIEFVTLSSVFHAGKPAVARIRLVPQEKGSGPDEVVYEEIPLINKYVKYIDEPLQYERSLSICKGVRDFKISYYGEWKFIAATGYNDLQVEYRWQETFDGAQKHILPEQVEIKTTTDKGEETVLYSIKVDNPSKRTFFHQRQQ